ncbi:unnamed protein product [Sphagnum tenellum]
MVADGEERVLITAQQIVRSLGTADIAMTDDMLQILSNFDHRFSSMNDKPKKLEFKQAKQQRIFECLEEEASTYLEAVDEVQNLLDQLSVQNKEEEQQPATLERAQNVIQLSMERLEEEFCHFLRRTADMWTRIGSLIPWQWLDRLEALSMTIIILP